MGSKKKKNSRIMGFDGDPCPRCGAATLIIEHVSITDRLKSQPFFYSRWFECRTDDCQTRQIMPDRYRVFPDLTENAPATAETRRRIDAVVQQLKPPWED